MANHVKATTSFAGACLIPGKENQQVDIAAGRTYRDDHPGYFGREHLFEPLDDGESEPAIKVPRRQTGVKTA